MTKALLIEKAKDNEQIANYIEKIVEIINKDKENYSDNMKEIFKIMLTQIIKNKIGKEKTDEFLKKLNIGGDKDMMAVFETIQQDNKRIYRRGKKEGIMEKSIEIAKKLLKENFSKEKVKPLKFSFKSGLSICVISPKNTNFAPFAALVIILFIIDGSIF